MKRSVGVLLLASCMAGAQVEAGPSTKAEKLVNEGLEAERLGDLETAVADFRKALQLEPENSAARMGLGAAYYSKGDYNSARRVLEALMAAEPRNAKAAVLLADVYIKLGREADAVPVLAPLEAGHEADLELEYALGYAMIQSGQIKDGAARMEKVAAARRSAGAWMIAALAHFHANEFRPARDDAEKAITIDPSLAAAWSLDGQAKYVLEDTAGAVQSLKEALKRDPRDFDANLYLGIARAKERDFETAQPLLELALSLRPKYPLARLELAKLLVATGKRDEALEMLESLTKDEPQWFDAHWELASLYFDLGRPEDGKRERALARELQAKHPQK